MQTTEMKQNRLWWAVFLAASWLMATTCPAAAPPIQIAAVLPLTGQAQAFGEAAMRGARVAVNEINAGGGVLGRPLALVPIDNRSTPLTAKQAAEKAVKGDVIGVVGAMWSTHSLAVAPVLQNAGIPMISPGSTAPEVTRVGDYIFRTCYTDDFQGKLMADFAFQSLGAHTAAVFTNLNETYSQTLARYFMAAFVRNPGTVLTEAGYKSTAIDFKAILEPLLAKTPDVVFIPGYTHDSGLLIRQARSMGIGSTFLGGDAWEATISAVAGAALEGSYFSTHWHPRVPYPSSRRFITRYTATYGKTLISPFSALAYDAVWLFAEATRTAGTVDRRQIRDALAGITHFDGATGAITFDRNGDPVRKGASIMKYDQGKWVFYKAFEPQE
ncbi:MAG: ABC transporter substrate-binding protein [Pseudomonadota bacterium]